MRRTQLLCFAMALLVVPSLAVADSISPNFDSQTLDVGNTYTISKTVTVDGKTRLDNDAIDIVFVFDTSSGMTALEQLAWTNGTVPTALVNHANDTGANVNFGVVEYVDFDSPWSPVSGNAYTKIQDLSGSTANTVSALSGLTLGGGGDIAEANVHALGTLADTGGISWRANSTRVVLWFGDEPGHEPTEFDGFGNPYPGAYSTTTALQALLGADVVVEAFDFMGFQGLDSTGQASTITGGTGGDLWGSWWPTIGPDANDRLVGLADTVFDGLEEAIFKYLVSLGTSLTPAQKAELGLTGLAPTFAGTREDGTLQYVWNLSYTPTAAAAGKSYNFTIDAMLDGVRFDFEEDVYSVRGNGTTPGPEVPEPSTLALMGLGLLGVGVVARRRRK